MFSGMPHNVQLLQFFENVCLKCVRIATWTFLGHVTSSVTLPIFNRPFLIGAPLVLTQSLKDFEMGRLKCMWVTRVTP